MPEAVPFDLPFDEAIAFFARKGLALSPDSWRDVWGKANVRSFSVARVTALDVLTDIRSEMRKAIESGTSLAEFKQNLIPRLRDKGWFSPKGEKAKVVLPDGTERKRLAPWRLDTIYRTNIQSAYSAGRYKQMTEVAAQRPYWQYMAIMDSKTRSTHAAHNGKVYDYRHPFWDKWYPPAGFNCRCYVKSLSPEDVKARGLEIETRGTDLMPDEGWDYNVGEEFLSWDRTAVAGMPPAFRASDAQKTFRGFGRPDVRDVPPEWRLAAPEHIPTAAEAGFERSFDLVLRAVGIEPGMDSAVILTADGDMALMLADKVKHLFDAGDGRERYAGYIVPTLQDPFEVYLTEYTDSSGKKVSRKRYIGLFAGSKKEDYLVVLDQGRDGSIFWNAFTRERKKIDKARVGELIYGKGI